MASGEGKKSKSVENMCQGQIADTEYSVDDITNTRITKNKNGVIVTEFEVKWTGYTKKGWEPMENVYKCPFLFERLEKKSRTRMLSRLTASQKKNPAITGGIPNFPSIPESIKSTFRNPLEHIPKGNEKIALILYELKRDGDKFWYVRFVGDDNAVYFVRKCVMEYYFPFASSCFFLERDLHNSAIERVVGSH